jgi:hypothetical protein
MLPDKAHNSQALLQPSFYSIGANSFLWKTRAVINGQHNSIIPSKQFFRYGIYEAETELVMGSNILSLIYMMYFHNIFHNS